MGPDFAQTPPKRPTATAMTGDQAYGLGVRSCGGL